MTVFDVVSRLPVLGFDAAVSHQRLCTLAAESQALLDGSPGNALRAVPSVSGWSPAQHIHHQTAILDELLGWVLTRCTKAEEDDAEGGPKLAGCVVLLTGRIPRGRAQTPSQYAPPSEPEPEAVRAMLNDVQVTLDALEPHRPRFDTLRGRRKHPRVEMGVLNPREWMRFAEIHTRHHQRIMRDIVAAQ